MTAESRHNASFDKPDCYDSCTCFLLNQPGIKPNFHRRLHSELINHNAKVKFKIFYWWHFTDFKKKTTKIKPY